ncbi:MATE family efflux transporter [Bacillus weihaiensis]|nr:MATE family efflux transporter [Bacillus weihaiensis]
MKKNIVFSQREFMVLAIPLIISGISTPILGAVDTAVIGRIPDPASIGGVAIGAVIFNTLYWLLGFLRVSTSGFTAQAEGANNQTEVLLSFLRPMVLAILFGLIFVLFQKPILAAAFLLLGGGEAVQSYAATYFSIRIWSAPFILASYVIIGWLIGLGKVKLALVTQVVMNVMNIVLDVLFVMGFGMGVEGVALATLIAEISGVSLGMLLIYWKDKEKFSKVDMKLLLEAGTLVKMMKVNRDLFLRTVCLLAMTGIFTSMGASMGEVTLAANAILLQIQYIMAYFFSGFANASSIVVGRAIGGKQYPLYRRAYLLSGQWGLLSAILLALLIFTFGETIVSFFAVNEEVRGMANSLLGWMLLFPLVGFWGLQLEGIFAGATEAKPVRDSIVLALIIFLAVLWFFVPVMQNHGIWLAFILFSFSRSFFLSVFIPRVGKGKF